MKKKTSHIWDGDTLEILLPETTKGHFQLSYGAGFFTVIDDVKLEYEEQECEFYPQNQQCIREKCPFYE